MTGREAAKSAEKRKSYVSHYYARLSGRQRVQDAPPRFPPSSLEAVSYFEGTSLKSFPNLDVTQALS
jgi:hypothetical protein